MNRMMYVEGNPMRYGDVDGNNAHIHMFNQMIKHGVFGATKILTQVSRSIGRGADYAGRKAGRGMDGAFRQLISGGNYSRNRGNDLDAAFGGTKTIFRGIERSNFGNWLTKVYEGMRTKPMWRSLDQKNKKNWNKFIENINACVIIFESNQSAMDQCRMLASAEYQRKYDKINREPDYGKPQSSDSSHSGGPTPVEWIVFTCNFSNPGAHETSQFCQDDPKNPNNQDD